MTDITALVVDTIHIWTSAIERKSGAGRGGKKRISLYGIERLRALILDLAVRGKLTPQDAGDEPASELLKRARKARDKKVVAGLARKPKAFSPLPSGLPSLPNGWAWTQLAVLAEINPSNSADDDSQATFVPMALVSTRIDGKHQHETRQWGEIKKGFTQFAEGDLGIAKITPCFENGKAAIFQDLANGIGAGTTELHVARPWLGELNRRYLLLTMKTRSYLSNGERQMTGTAGQKRITRSYFESTPIPLPPLAEQRRIVAKVDELMALCDALERESADAMTAHQALVAALLATLVNSTDAADLAHQWARMENHFDALFTTDASIDALKQTVLDLAVRGKLVTQDAGDVEAKSLMEALASERPKSAVSSKKFIERDNDDEPFSVPSNWAWARLGDLSELITSGSRDWAKYLSDDGAKFVTMGNLSRGSYELRLDKMHFVSVDKDREGTRTSLQAGDLLVSITGDVGNLALIPENFGEAYINQHTALIRVLPSMRGHFLPEVLRSPLAQKQFNEPQRGVKNSFRLSDIQNIKIPIPPLAEQRRIVAKIAALMTLCDALKARLADATQTQRHLADAITEQAAA